MIQPSAITMRRGFEGLLLKLSMQAHDRDLSSPIISRRKQRVDDGNPASMETD
jgi:hypothetical protein